MGKLGSEPEGRVKRNSIGEDFVIWAEEYWRLKEVYTEREPKSTNKENINYEAMRKIFAETIDRFLEVRLKDADILK